MTLAHQSELFPFLEQIGAAPRKGLSQNFLIDANIVRKICTAANVQENDTVLEIGPGPGALTQELLKRGARVIAIEKDTRFARELPRLDSENRLQVIEGDFFDIPLDKISKAPMKIVANLPYHITTPILERLCEHHALFSSAYVMVQKEVAERMIARHGTKEISSFTIFLKTFSDTSIALKVSRNCFYPAPNVDSCVVKLDFHEPPLKDYEPFLAFVRKAYQQRRKMLRSTLKITSDPYSSLRPEALSYDNWLEVWLGAV